MKKQLEEDNIFAYIFIGIFVIIVYALSSVRYGLESRWYNYVGIVLTIALLQWIYRIVIRAINKRRKS